MSQPLFSCAGFSNPLHDTIAAGVLATAEGIRTGPAVNDAHDWIDKIVGDAARRFASSMFVVGGWDWRLPDGSLYQRRDMNLLRDPGKEHLANQCASVLAVWKQNGRLYENCWIEIGNELDGSYWKYHLDEFHELGMACYERVRSISPFVPFVTGSTMNFDRGCLWKKKGYEILRELCRLDWPVDTLQGLHPYRTKCRQDEWPSWSSSEKALSKLAKVLRGRGVAITEMGWHFDEFTDDEIAAFVGAELEMWDEFGAHCYAHYQIQDGPQPDNTGEGGFGAYKNIHDGFAPKPVAAVLDAWLVRKKAEAMT